jgi:hypothetical protein
MHAQLSARLGLRAETRVGTIVPASDAGHVAAELLASEGDQGTSWKPSPSSIMAKRPEASAKRNLIGTLRRRAVEALGEQLAAEAGQPFNSSAAGEYVAGYRQRAARSAARRSS